MASGGQEDRPNKTNYPSRDCRAEYGGPGLGAKPKTKGQPKGWAKPISQSFSVKLGGPDCSLCQGICCGVARALVEEAFGLGVTNLSPKVSKGVGCGVGTYFSFVFRLSIKYYVTPTLTPSPSDKVVVIERNSGRSGHLRYVSQV